jgi:hypothetical protein
MTSVQGWLRLLAVGVLGCKGEDPPDDIVPLDDGSESEDTAPPTVETGIEGTYLDARYFAVTARFAYDPDTNTHLSFAESGQGPSPIQLGVTIIDSSVESRGVVDEQNSCSVTLDIDGALPVASWVTTNGGWTGFDVPTATTVRDTCRFYGLPDAYGGDAGAQVAKWRFGVGVAPLDPDVADLVRSNRTPSEWAALEPYLVGGLLTSNLFGSGTATGDAVALGVVLGYEVDGNFEIVVDGVGNPEPIPKAEVQQVVGVARGYYEATFGQFDGLLLTGEPL